MPKYLSGRAKRVPQDQLSDDRYQYLALDQAEPNLADPLTGPSVPSGAQYQLVAVPGFPGKRYWVPVGGGLVPGAITIFDEGSIVSASSSITQLNFVGAAVTANVSVQSPSGFPGIAATITVNPVSITDNPPLNARNGELWWESDTGDLYVYYEDVNSAQWVTTNTGGAGPAGDKGQKGEKGQKGQNGLSGNQGQKGEKGDKGEKGSVEAQGNKGQKGEVGVGQKGQKGEKGDKGQKGTDGTDGTKGEKGQKGELGQKGEKGQKGTSGGGATVTISDSAPGGASTGDMWWDSDDFDLHVYYGDGDSNQWVSVTSNAALKGQKGEKGQKGDKGGKGEKGEKGQKGEVGASGNAGGDGAKGQKGEAGVSGTGTGTADKIFEGNTEAEVVDTGSDGHFKVTTEGTERLRVNSSGNVKLPDNGKLQFGGALNSGNGDLQIYHDTNHSYIVDQGTGELRLRANLINLQSADGSETMIGATENSNVNLYFNDNIKFSTTTDGVKITGGLQDKDGQLGTSGQVLSSTGTELNWVAATSGQKGQKGEVGTTTKGQKGEVGAPGAAADKGQKGQKGELNDKGQKGEIGVGDKGQKGEDNSTKGQKGQKGELNDKGQKGEIGATGTVFTSGTRMLFQQTSAPSGWTKVTSGVDNRALRIVTGTVGSGGGNGFTNVLNSTVTTANGSVSNHTLTTTQLAAHFHNVWTRNESAIDGSRSSGSLSNQPQGNWYTAGSGYRQVHIGGNHYAPTSGNTGGGGSHNHGFTNPNFNLNVAYTDVIIAQKN